MPSGTFVEVAAGAGFSMARTADGNVLAWGDNLSGQCNVPALRPGVKYAQIAGGWQHAVALRSDGSVIEWGGERIVLTPGPGWRFVKVVAATQRSLALRSDGLLEHPSPVPGMPTPPPGLRFLDIAASTGHFLALLSDGALRAWGDNSAGQCNVPPLPPGLVYVKIAAGKLHSVAQRSDGSVVAWGDNTWNQGVVPALPPGTTMVQIVGGHHGDFTIARFAPGGFFRSGSGCASSQGFVQLRAQAPPRIGQTLAVGFEPPAVAGAVFLLGLSNTASALGPLPIDLTAFGMPTCALHVSLDLALPTAGFPPRALLPLPANPTLTGARFHLQALILDPGVNPRGAVMSDAASAVVGM